MKRLAKKSFVHNRRVAPLLFILLVTGAPAIADSVLFGETLIESLRMGGYNIYFRHAQTDWSQQDHIDQAGDWKSCDPSRVRQLSDAGKDAARAVGEAMSALGVPVASVFASPYCRTVETAKLMGLGAVTPTTDIMNLRAAEFFGGRAAIVKTARRRLATLPSPGSNTVLVAHGNLARAATDVYPEEGEGLVFVADGSGGFRFVGRLTPVQWIELAKRRGQDR